MARVLAILVRIAMVLADFFRREKERRRVDAVRSDPAGQWLRKLGGTDKRASGSDNARSDSD